MRFEISKHRVVKSNQNLATSFKEMRPWNSILALNFPILENLPVYHTGVVNI